MVLTKYGLKEEDVKKIIIKMGGKNLDSFFQSFLLGNTIHIHMIGRRKKAPWGMGWTIGFSTVKINSFVDVSPSFTERTSISPPRPL